MDLGELGPDENIQIFSQMTPQGRTWGAKKIPVAPERIGE